MRHDGPNTATTPREFCYRCFRAAPGCLCQRIRPVDTRTGVTLIQHHRELRHPIGTARIVRLGFINSQVVVARRSSQLAVEADLPSRTGLLFPHATARDLANTTPCERPGHLIVLDGTWNQAKGLYRANPWLRALPHFLIHPTAASSYRIRRQPRSDCLSTIEALVQAMAILEPETSGVAQLLDVFDWMVERQMRHLQNGVA